MCRIYEFSKYYVIFIYFQAAVSALLAVSVLYIEKKSQQILHNVLKIQHISNSFFYDMPATQFQLLISVNNQTVGTLRSCGHTLQFFKCHPSGFTLPVKKAPLPSCHR